MKTTIRAMAARLGFDECRFASAAVPESAGHFSNWIQAHYHGEMGYLARNAHKRLNPQEVLPGARSVVCVALNYGHSPTPNSAPYIPHLRGQVARYACHADYHDVMGEKLRQLCGFLNQVGGEGSRSLWYVDTGPILEREFAHRSGLGFVGKHTNVISRRFGNWILLGEVLTTVGLAPDAPEKNRCGSCSRCITACPTQAITGPFQLDARRCISYLTIELKGSIPEALRPAIGQRIFGCDDCLEACPWNRFASEAGCMKRWRRGDLQNPDLTQLLSIDEETFRQRFRGTPIYRSKRRGLLRNVCVALGNAARPEALPALDKAARFEEPLIAEHAQWAIERVKRATSQVSD